ncbi:TPA: hypothetical protein ACGE6K_001309, partial [Serratia marcescens]
MGIVFPAYPLQTPHGIHLRIAARRSDLMCDRWCKEKAPRCVAYRRFGRGDNMRVSMSLGLCYSFL